MRHLIYYVALGPSHRDLTAMSLNSLYMAGFTGECHIVTDEAWAPDYAPADRVTFHAVPTGDVWYAKRLKATAPLNLFSVDGYDAVFFTDSDTLFTADIGPMLDRIAQNPAKLYVTKTAEKDRHRLVMATKARDLFSPELQREHEHLRMLDSSGVGFAPTARNLGFMADWRESNERHADTLKRKSDAYGLNHAVITSGRLPDVEFLPEAERMNGAPLSETIIRHYPNHQLGLMRRVYQGEIVPAYLNKRHVHMSRVSNSDTQAPHLQAKQRKGQATRRTARAKKSTKGTK